MKTYLRILLIIWIAILLTNCRSVKKEYEYKQTETTETSTTIIPTEVVFKADTAKDNHNMDKFSNDFRKALTGDIIAQKKGVRVKYKVRKVSDDDFEIEAEADEIKEVVYPKIEDVKKVIKTDEKTKTVTKKDSKFFIFCIVLTSLILLWIFYPALERFL
jgi:hypothetical protein